MRGLVRVEWNGMLSDSLGALQLSFNGIPARPVSISRRFLTAQIPEGATSGMLRLEASGEPVAETFFEVGVQLAGDLHPVANPAVDSEGDLFVTYSGSRGERVPVSIFKISPSGEKTPYNSEIVNPTSIAFNTQGLLFVSSRLDGKVYVARPYGELEVFAENLGITTGIAFGSDGALYVGDRSGTIFRVDEAGVAEAFATLEPSVSAYHLAFDNRNYLYVSGPTLSSYDNIYRLSPAGEVGIFYTGLGRPEGMAFDVENNLYVAASLGGQRGLVRITSEGEAELVVSAPNLIGVAFDREGNAFMVNRTAAFRLFLGIEGKTLP